MSTYKKMIFLKSNSETNSQIFATLTLEKKNADTFGEMKIYHAQREQYILGIKSDDKIIKQNINLINDRCLFKCSKDINIDTPISCVLFEQDADNIKQLLYGTEQQESGARTAIVSAINTSINKIRSNINSNLEKTKAQTQSQPQESVYNKIGCSEEIATVQNYAHLFENNESEIEQTIDDNIESSSHNFYNMIAEQLDDLFSTYPREENLEKLIDNSRWVKINHDFDNKYYVVGIIYNNNDIKYICYGVPGNYNTEQPKELIGYSQWLPIDVSNPYDNGYWVMYQDADTGENIKIE